MHVATQDARWWRPTDAQLLIALSCLHEVRAQIDELEVAVADVAMQSEHAREKLIADGNSDSYALKLTALE
jgi:hypothetical protein